MSISSLRSVDIPFWFEFVQYLCFGLAVFGKVLFAGKFDDFFHYKFGNVWSGPSGWIPFAAAQLNVIELYSLAAFRTKWTYKVCTFQPTHHADGVDCTAVKLSSMKRLQRNQGDEWAFEFFGVARAALGRSKQTIDANRRGVSAFVTAISQMFTGIDARS